MTESANPYYRPHPLLLTVGKTAHVITTPLSVNVTVCPYDIVNGGQPVGRGY